MDDAISREYLFKVLDDFCGRDRTATITLDTLADLVYDMPPVTQNPDISKYRKEAKRWKNKWLKSQKSGRWKKIESGDKDFPESIVCSKCGCENSHLDFGIGAEPIGKVFVTSKFCPNCGAKMVESQESEVRNA
jgi:hypothetical protein